MVTYTLTWEVYGYEGHRQRESFNKSYEYDFSCKQDGIRNIAVSNSDVTGTNEYSIVRITRNTYFECINEFEAQLWDGIFENSRVGKRIMTEIEETKYYEKNGRYYKKSYYQTPSSDNWIESSAHRISKESYMKVTVFDDGEGEYE